MSIQAWPRKTQTPHQTDAAVAAAERIRDLARLLPLWPHELADTSTAGRRRIVALMERALRAERRRGRAGHWAYDLGRHAALFRALTRERVALKAAEMHQIAKRKQPAPRRAVQTSK